MQEFDVRDNDMPLVELVWRDADKKIKKAIEMKLELLVKRPDLLKKEILQKRDDGCNCLIRAFLNDKDSEDEIASSILGASVFHHDVFKAVLADPNADGNGRDFFCWVIEGRHQKSLYCVLSLLEEHPGLLAEALNHADGAGRNVLMRAIDAGDRDDFETCNQILRSLSYYPQLLQQFLLSLENAHYSLSDLMQNVLKLKDDKDLVIYSVIIHALFDSPDRFQTELSVISHQISKDQQNPQDSQDLVQYLHNYFIQLIQRRDLTTFGVLLAALSFQPELLQQVVNQVDRDGLNRILQAMWTNNHHYVDPVLLLLNVLSGHEEIFKQFVLQSTKEDNQRLANWLLLGVVFTHTRLSMLVEQVLTNANQSLGSAVISPDRDHCTGLLQAISEQNTTVVEHITELLSNSPNLLDGALNSFNYKCQNCLTLAIANGDYTIIKLLLNAIFKAFTETAPSCLASLTADQLIHLVALLVGSKEHKEEDYDNHQRVITLANYFRDNFELLKLILQQTDANGLNLLTWSIKNDNVAFIAIISPQDDWSVEEQDHDNHEKLLRHEKLLKLVLSQVNDTEGRNWLMLAVANKAHDVIGDIAAALVSCPGLLNDFISDVTKMQSSEDLSYMAQAVADKNPEVYGIIVSAVADRPSLLIPIVNGRDEKGHNGLLKAIAARDVNAVSLIMGALKKHKFLLTAAVDFIIPGENVTCLYYALEPNSVRCPELYREDIDQNNRSSTIFRNIFDIILQYPDLLKSILNRRAESDSGMSFFAFAIWRNVNDADNDMAERIIKAFAGDFDGLKSVVLNCEFCGCKNCLQQAIFQWNMHIANLLVDRFADRPWVLAELMTQVNEKDKNKTGWDYLDERTKYQPNKFHDVQEIMAAKALKTKIVEIAKTDLSDENSETENCRI